MFLFWSRFCFVLPVSINGLLLPFVGNCRTQQWSQLTQYEVISIADNKSAATARMSPKQADRAHINELNNV